MLLDLRRGLRFRNLSGFFNYGAGIVLLLALAAAAGCSSGSAYDPAVEYAKAVQDASTVTYEKISTTLTAIVPDNKALIWENNMPGSRVLVVSWASENVAKYYMCPPEGCKDTDICKEGKECPGYKYDNWVTVVPELKNFFGSAIPDPMRIAQLLGLPPYYASRPMYMIEMWVSPKDLFRPCPDPEITDHECQTNFPADGFWKYDNTQKVLTDQGCTPPNCPFLDYKGWFNNRRDHIYTAQTPYPWTRLGYTYDWGSSSPNHIGLSEFLVHGARVDGAGINVGIRTVTPTSAYFH